MLLGMHHLEEEMTGETPVYGKLSNVEAGPQV